MGFWVVCNGDAHGVAGRVDVDVLVVRDAAPTLRRRYVDVVHRRSLDILQ